MAAMAILTLSASHCKSHKNGLFFQGRLGECIHRSHRRRITFIGTIEVETGSPGSEEDEEDELYEAM
jgi:hypothetical protein